MKYANQTEFFLSEDCIPRNFRIRNRQRFDALRQEYSTLSDTIKWREEKQTERLKAAVLLKRIIELNVSIIKLKYFVGDNCINPVAANKELELVKAKIEEQDNLLRTAKEVNDVIASEKARLSEIDKELSELCNYIID